MTPEQVRKERVRLTERSKKLREQLELVKLKFKFLQGRCKHPKKKSYSDVRMGGGVYCEDCGYET